MKNYIELTNAPVGKGMAQTVQQAAQEQCSVLAGLDVHWLFRPSFVDCETGKHGMRWLIARILTQSQAVFPLFTDKDREVYVNFGLTTEEITEQVRQVNGFDKYPDKTIADILNRMVNESQAGSIRMTNQEDCYRPCDCKVPRNKWYLLAE